MAFLMLTQKHALVQCYTLSAPSWGPRLSFECKGGRPDICRVLVSCVDAFLEMGGVASCTGVAAFQPQCLRTSPRQRSMRIRRSSVM